MWYQKECIPGVHCEYSIPSLSGTGVEKRRIDITIVILASSSCWAKPYPKSVLINKG